MMISRLYAITDRRWMGRDPIGAIRRLCSRYGVRLSIQIREKDLGSREVCRWIDALLPDLNGARLLINGRADIARCFDGVGVHLPEDGLTIPDGRHILGSERPIGASAHTAADAIAARNAGADLVTLSPIFESPGKGAPIGLAPLREAAPIGGIYALGGIARDNITEVLATGVEGVAAIRAAWNDTLERSEDSKL